MLAITEFKIRNGKYMDKWPNTSTSVRPFTKMYGCFMDLVYKLLIKKSEKGMNTFASVQK